MEKSCHKCFILASLLFIMPTFVTTCNYHCFDFIQNVLTFTYIKYELFKYWELCNSYNMGTRDLPDIYAQARGQARGHEHIYQANPKCLCIYHFQHSIKICPNLQAAVIAGCYFNVSITFPNVLLTYSVVLVSRKLLLKRLYTSFHDRL